MEQVQIAVIGAGASGLMAARCAGLSLKKRRAQGAVVLLEGNAKPGKKLLATGNGRCNLLHMQPEASCYHGDVVAGMELLQQIPPARILQEFQDMGLLTVTDGEGRVYPRNLQAAAVLQALRYGCEEVDVCCKWDFPVFSMVKGAAGFHLKSEDGREITAQKVILATGGLASPKHSGNKNGIALVESLGHRSLPATPGLVPLGSSHPMLRRIKGMRSKGEVTLLRKGEQIASRRGEVIFGERALSGICIFDLSSYLQGDPREYTVELDLVPELTQGELEQYFYSLRRTMPHLPGGELLSGVVNLRVGQEILRPLLQDRLCELEKLPPSVNKEAAKAVKHLLFPITGLGEWDQAQITRGGVPLSQVDLSTMESKIQPGLYLTGELLNLDGACGGYNLYWAWATGLAAGSHAGSGVIQL